MHQSATSDRAPLGLEDRSQVGPAIWRETSDCELHRHCLRRLSPPSAIPSCFWHPSPFRRRNARSPEGTGVAGNPPGLVGYRGKVPVGWVVSIGPREDYAKLKRSPVMKAVDEQPVWSVICFVVPAEYRGQGVARALLKGALAYAKEHGATLVEAYPVDKPTRSNDDYMWFGAKSMYDKARFKEVARRKPQRPIVRIKPA